MPLGASRAVEAERIRAAREADLARTIEAIDVVQTARVHLAAEQPSVFVRSRSNAAASVMLTLAPGRTLGEQPGGGDRQPRRLLRSRPRRRRASR